jgi:branched-chain amino acid transport system permease protein
MARLSPALGLAVVALAVAGYLLPPYYAGLIIEGLIYTIFALGLNLLLGYTGLPSLGHAAYFGAGAYAAALVSLHVSQSLWVGAIAGIATAMAMAAVFGLLALRTTGVYFLMITLALGQVAWAIAFTWRRVTNGDDGLRGIKRPYLGIEGFGLPKLGLDDRNVYFLFALIATVAALALMRAIVRSPFGRSLQGIRENSQRMEALGYSAWLHKYLAFVVSGGFAGFAGVVLVYYKGFVSPETTHVMISAEVMLMVIVGGAGSLFGPMVGAFFIVLLSYAISGYTAHWPLALGLLYIAVVLLAPKGLIEWTRQRLAPKGAL